MILVENLWKRYGRFFVLRDVVLHIERGLFYIYGLNGSGKSTLMNILSGFDKSYTGKIRVDGRISFSPQEPKLYEDFKVEDYSHLLKSLSGNGEVFNDMCERLNIKTYQKTHSLSHGIKKALSVIIAVSMNADVYLFDEPLLGVDERRRKIIMGRLEEIGKGGKIVIATESEKIVKPDFVLQGGKLNES